MSHEFFMVMPPCSMIDWCLLLLFVACRSDAVAVLVAINHCDFYHCSCSFLQTAADCFLYSNISPFDGLLWQLLSPVTMLLLMALFLVLFLLLLDHCCVQTIKFLLSCNFCSSHCSASSDSCWQLFINATATVVWCHNSTFAVHCHFNTVAVRKLLIPALFCCNYC